PRNSTIHAISFDSAGRIIAAGGDDGVFDLARFNRNGSLDKTFGSAGQAAIVGDAQPNSAADNLLKPGGPFFSAVAVRASDGEIFAAGGSPRDTFYSAGGGPLVVAAFTSNGRLDRHFASRGI